MLGRIPSAVGYQPTLATDMGSMQERITTTKKGSITSVQASPKAELKKYYIYSLCLEESIYFHTATDKPNCNQSN